MLIPQHFFFRLSQSSLKYQKAVSGNADFNRLILQGRPDFWISPQSADKCYPKNIFLCASVLLDKSFTYRQNLHALLVFLNKHHFSIYIQDADANFYPLDSACFEVYCQDVYFPTEDYIETWNKEQTLCLDLYDIQYCFQEILNIHYPILLKKSFLPTLSASVIEKFFSNSKTQFVSDIGNDYLKRKQLTYNFKAIKNTILSKFNDINNDEYYFLDKDGIEHFIDSSTEQIHTLVCNKLNFDEQLKQKITSMCLRKFSFENCYAEDGYLFLPQTITHLEIRSEITLDDFINLLNHLINLKSLRIETSIGSCYERYESSTSFLNIVDLYLQDSDDLNLINYFPNIKSLELDFITLTIKIALPYLVKLSCHSDLLLSFLKSNPQLSLMDVLELSKDDLHAIDLVFPRINHVWLISDSIFYLSNLDNFCKLNHVFPRLKVLCMALNELQSFEKKVKFKYIDELQLDYYTDSVSFEVLIPKTRDFFSACPQLLTIELKFLPALFLGHELWRDYILNIKTLRLNKCAIDRDFFLNFLRVTPHLEILDLSENRIDLDALDIYMLPDYSQVREITLPELSSTEDLFKLLTIFSKLEVLKLYQFFRVDDKSTSLCFPHLPYLKKIKLYCHKSFETIPQEIVFALLDSAPNLDDDSKQHLLDYIEPQQKTGDCSKSVIFDADTRPKSASFHLSACKIFSYVNKEDEIDVSKYRLNTYETLIVNPSPCTIQEVFHLSTDTLDDLIDVNIPCLEDQCINISPALQQELTILMECLFCQIPLQSFNLSDLTMLENLSFGDLLMGTISLTGKPGWHPLPSLAPDEELLCYEDAKANRLAFKYSRRANLFYVKTTEFNTRIKIYLYVRKRLELESILDPASVPIEFCQFLVAAYKHYADFGIGELALDPTKVYTGQDYIALLNQQRVGSCRHRAVLFKHLMSQHYPDFPCRIVTNDVHAYIELSINGYWITVDLGGYPATIEYKEPLTLASHLSEEQRQELKQLRQENLAENAADAADSVNYFTHQLKQLRQPESKLDFKDLVAELLLSQAEKRLIECNTQDELQGLQYGLQRALYQEERALYYVHKPADLHCSGKTLQLLDDATVAISANQHPLFKFLTTHQDGYLIINYDNFSAEEYVAYNEMLDDKRVLHGIPIPARINIIGLRLQNDFIPENDFYSRFKTIHKASFSGIESIELPLQHENEAQLSAASVSYYPLQLFNSPDWEGILLGKWHINTQGWYFEKGSLITALERGISHFTIHNGPWDNDDFCHFWKQATIFKQIEYAGRQFELPKQFKICIESAYDAGTYFEFQASATEGNYFILNPYTYHYFFQNYQLEGENLIETAGYIQQARSHLSILITEPISEHQWARFVFHCNEQGLSLHVAIAPAVDREQLSFIRSEMPVKIFKTQHTQLIYTNDTDGILGDYRDDYIIDVSELNESDLLSTIVVHVQDETYVFSEKPGFLNKAIGDKKIVLKGDFSPALISALTPCILEDKDYLVIITEDEHAFSFFECRKQWVDRQAFMRQTYGEGLFLEGSIAEMTARYHSVNPWQGMLSLDSCHKKPSDDSMDNEALCHARSQLIRDVLARQPYVYIAGISGVGKSTFIKTQFIMEDDEALFIDDAPDSVKAWIESSAKLAILFIDEANLKTSQFSQFEGLFLPQPAIFYAGEYHLLSEGHKVIFAGNPLNYGDERQFSRFFQRHGNAIVFQPLPLSIIRSDILQPLLGDKEALIEVILKLYSQLCQLSENELLISPRELETLALWTLRDQTSDALATLNYHIYYLLKGMLDDITFLRYCQMNDLTSAPQAPHHVAELNSDKHLMLPTRASIANLLRVHLELHQLRVSGKAVGHLQQHGGLGGILLEGAVGLGKSELVKHMLDKLNISYINIAASLSVSEKEKCLLQAFHRGQVVWMDELNTSAVLEQLLNALLMGKTLADVPPKRFGFMLIATQNPATMSGRRQLSPALLRRFLRLKVDEYSLEEMITIFQHKGMTEKSAQALARAYQGLQGHISFRDALKFMPAPSNPLKRRRNGFFGDHESMSEDEFERSDMATNSFS